MNKHHKPERALVGIFLLAVGVNAFLKDTKAVELTLTDGGPCALVGDDLVQDSHDSLDLEQDRTRQ
jgi:hypothetical protein